MIRLKIILLVAIVMLSCGRRPAETVPTGLAERDSATLQTPTVNSRKLVSKTGFDFIVQEDHPMGLSVSDIRIFSSKSRDTINMLNSDPILDLLTHDLDGDGFEELIVITGGAGSGSHGLVRVVIPDTDNHFQVILLPEYDPKDPDLKGYMGKDQYLVDTSAHVIIRSFPVFKPGDSNSNPTGGSRSIRYRLIKKEGKYVLDRIK